MKLSDNDNPDNKKVVIGGGGPAGLTAAYELSKAGVESVVLEKDHQVGGISKTVSYKNYHFDIGGHRFFTKVERVQKMWEEVLGEDFIYRKRLSRIFFNKKFFYYPLRPLNALIGLGLKSSFLILITYLQAHMFPSKEEDTFEQWVTNRFGKHLYKTFFKTYTEKVWGIPCSEIKAEWAAQRIKGLSLPRAIRNAFINSQSKTKTTITTLIDGFHYPKLGPGMMWQKVTESIKKDGVQVHLGAEIKEILWEKNKVVAFLINLNGVKSLIHGTHFISSMPIKELIPSFKPAVPESVLEAAKGLNYRDFISVIIIVDRRDVFLDNWIYIHEPGVKLGRIQNFKNWSPDMVPDLSKTCLGLEYFCFEGDDFWRLSDKELISLAKKELSFLGLVQENEVEDATVVRMPKAYPMYDSTYKESLRIVKNFLDGIENLQVVGRNGQHRYNNQDHSMLTAMRAVENILGANHNVWEVNRAQEYHEEGRKVILEKEFIHAFDKFDKFALATAMGSVSGLGVFIATLWLTIMGGESAITAFQLLSEFFIGYSVTVKGAFIGMSYTFLWSFLFGWLFAYLRNFFLGLFIYRVKRKLEMLSFRSFLDHF